MTTRTIAANMLHRALLLLMPIALLSCSGTTAPTSTAPTVAASSTTTAPTPCELSQVQRDRVPGLLAEGPLNRTLRVIDKANTLCPSEASRTWAAEVNTLAELVKWLEMRSIAKRIDSDGDEQAKAAASRARERAANSDEAKAPMRETYGAATLALYADNWAEAYEGYLKAWEQWRPNGQALMQAGLAANPPCYGSLKNRRLPPFGTSRTPPRRAGMRYDVAADDAAERHFRDGVVLLEKKRFDNAGYHFGISAECAVKHLLVKRCHVPVGDDVIRKLHFPQLLGAALQVVEGRRGKLVSDLLRKPGYLQGWDIRMRYATTGSVMEKTVLKWKEDAQGAIGALVS